LVELCINPGPHFLPLRADFAPIGVFTAQLFISYSFFIILFVFLGRISFLVTVSSCFCWRDMMRDRCVLVMRKHQVLRTMLSGCTAALLLTTVAACGNASSSSTVTASQAFNSGETAWFLSSSSPSANTAINSVLVFDQGKVTYYNTSSQIGTTATLTFADVSGLDTQDIIAKAQSADESNYSTAVKDDISMYQGYLQSAEQSHNTAQESSYKQIIKNLQNATYHTPTAEKYMLSPTVQSGSSTSQKLTFTYQIAENDGTQAEEQMESNCTNVNCVTQLSNPYAQMTYSSDLMPETNAKFTVNSSAFAGYSYTDEDMMNGYLTTETSSHKFTLDPVAKKSSSTTSSSTQ